MGIAFFLVALVEESIGESGYRKFVKGLDIKVYIKPLVTVFEVVA